MLWNVWLCMVITGVILLIISLVLIFVFRIPDLLDELSGRKAKRQIKRLKELNIGTGSLEEMATDDIYLSMPSGTLLSEEIIAVNSKEDNSLKSDIVDSSIESTYEEGTTTDMSGDDSTNFMEEENATSFIDDSDATGILDGVRDYCTKRQIIQIIEEQTSL